MALGDIQLRFTWQAWHLWHWAGSGGAFGRAWSPVTPRHFTWQTWHLATSTVVSRGWHLVHRYLAWQAWHLATSTFVSRGRPGTYKLLWHWAGSGGTLGRACSTPRHFAWQAWDLVTSTVILRGRRGTWRHPLSFHVAGVAFYMALGWLWWRAWAGLVAGDAAALCVAGVALGDIHRSLAWRAWHLATSTFVSRGRRGTYGTGLALVTRWAGLVAGDAAALCVAGVALGDIHLRFTWQAWYRTTSRTIFRIQLCHTHNLSHRTCHTITQLCHTPSLAQCMRLAFCVQTINTLHTISNSVIDHL